MTTNSWYEAVAADAPITQGDLLADFPLVGWKSEAIQIGKRGQDSLIGFWHGVPERIGLWVLQFGRFHLAYT